MSKAEWRDAIITLYSSNFSSGGWYLNLHKIIGLVLQANWRYFATGDIVKPKINCRTINEPLHAKTSPRQSAGIINLGRPLVILTVRTMKPSSSTKGAYWLYTGGKQVEQVKKLFHVESGQWYHDLIIFWSENMTPRWFWNTQQCESWNAMLTNVPIFSSKSLRECLAISWMHKSLLFFFCILQ